MADEPIVEPKIDAPAVGFPIDNPAPVAEPVIVAEPVVEDTAEQKYWKTEYNKHFGDEDIETVKSYKTKAAEYEPKIKEYEGKLAERETELQTLKERRFANERIAKLNELAENGVEVDENLVAFLHKDYNKISDPLIGLAEDLRNQHPDWSEKKIQFELKGKYRLDQIQPDEDGELTDAQKEIKEIIDEDINRDWNNAKKALIEKQDKTRIVKPTDPNIAIENEKRKQAAIDNWKNDFEKVKNIGNLKYEFEKGKGIKVNDVDIELDPFEFTPDKEDLQSAYELFNTNSPASETNFFQKLIKDNGDPKSAEERHKIVMDAIITLKTHKKSMQKAAAAYFQKGYELAVKQDKNTSDPKGKGTGAGGGVPQKGFPAMK